MVTKRVFQLCTALGLGFMSTANALPMAPVMQPLTPTTPVTPMAPVMQPLTPATPVTYTTAAAPAQTAIGNVGPFALVETLSGTVPGNGTLGDIYGSSVALDSDKLVVSAAGACPGSLQLAGSLYYYDRSRNTQFTQSQDPSTTALAGDQICTCKIAGDWLFATAQGQGGRVLAYRKTSKGYQLVTTVTADDLSEGDHFGNSIAADISNHWLFISAPGQAQNDKNGNPVLAAGSVYVYKINKNSITFQQKLTKPDGYTNVGTNFGISSAIQDSYALIGSDNGSATGANGSVYVFANVNGGWVCSQVISGSVAEATVGDGFGRSVSMDGAYAVVGAPFDSSSGKPLGGKFYIYKAGEKKGVRVWRALPQVNADVVDEASHLGAKVIIDHKNIFVSQLNRSSIDGAPYQGAVLVYKIANNTWEQIQTISGTTPYSFTGFDFDYNHKTKTLAIGSNPSYDFQKNIPFARNFKTTQADNGQVLIYKAGK